MNTVTHKGRRIAVFGTASLALTLLAITASAHDSAGAASGGVDRDHSATVTSTRNDAVAIDSRVQRCYRGVTDPASL
jgi:hypothetical protein